MKKNQIYILLLGLPCFFLSQCTCVQKKRQLDKINEIYRNQLDNVVNNMTSERDVLQKIKSHSQEAYESAEKMVAATEDFVNFCNSLKDEMIKRTGGYDEEKKRKIVGYKNREIIKTVLVDESRGVEFKKKIDDLRELHLTISKGSEDTSNRIITSKDWDSKKYIGMPLAAMLPILTKYESSAKNSKSITLNFLIKKYE